MSSLESFCAGFGPSGKWQFQCIQYDGRELSIVIQPAPFGEQPSVDHDEIRVIFHGVASFGFIDDCCMTHRTEHRSSILEWIPVADHHTYLPDVGVAAEFLKQDWHRLEVTAGCQIIEVLCSCLPEINGVIFSPV